MSIATPPPTDDSAPLPDGIVVPDHYEAPPVPAKSAFEWLAVGEGLTALAAILALIVSLVALSQSGGGGTTTVQMPATGSGSTASTMMSGAGATGAATAAPVGTPVSLTVNMKNDVEHAKKGPDGKWHDAALPANFTVQAGHQVTLTINNYDDMPHSFTAPGLGVNQTIPGGGANNPSVTKFTFIAPTKAGKYLWRCLIPCDPFSMKTIGYMRGYVTVTA